MCCAKCNAGNDAFIFARLSPNVIPEVCPKRVDTFRAIEHSQLLGEIRMIACCHRFQVTAFTLSVSLIAACLYPPTASAETEGGAKTTNQSSVNLQEVVVTAQKRSENIQVVPETVTVLSPDALAAQQLNTLEDITALVPGNVELKYWSRAKSDYPSRSHVGTDAVEHVGWHIPG